MDSMNTGGRRGTVGASTAAGRTVTFLLAGLGLLLLGAWLNLRPALRAPDATTEAAVGKLLFPDFTDPGRAASLRIVDFDEDTTTLDSFEVAKTGGVWVISSRRNYPADAREQMAAAATELADRPIIDMVSTSPGDHELYGVKEPIAEKLAAGDTGVGQLVEIRDASNNPLAKVVIGKEFKRRGPATGRTLRYVRKAGQDPVYLVELDTSKFTTKFDDWIEKDLLKISSWDVTRLTIDDSSWSLVIGPNGRPGISVDRKSLIRLAYDDKESKWALTGLTDFGDGGETERELGPDEELASAKLNDLRNSLADLKIVDVFRKPSGLSGDLKADKTFIDDDAAVTSLAQNGFFPVQSGEVLSSSGETVVGMKDGVEYMLRFGNPVSAGTGAKAGEGTGGRYLFVVARFNEGLLDKPELQPLPDLPESPAAGQPAAGDGETAGQQPQPDEAARAPAGEGAADALAKADEAEAKAQAAVEERRRIERENRLAQEAYDDKVKAAQKRVRELNNRFADWYYVVSDAEFAKIRLGRADVIQAKAADAAPATPAFGPAP